MINSIFRIRSVKLPVARESSVYTDLSNSNPVLPGYSSVHGSTTSTCPYSTD
eukprot:COSAG02_NODE_1308_length_13334_cov_5.973706_8_plen_52_part_00